LVQTPNFPGLRGGTNLPNFPKGKGWVDIFFKGKKLLGGCVVDHIPFFSPREKNFLWAGDTGVKKYPLLIEKAPRFGGKKGFWAPFKTPSV